MISETMKRSVKLIMLTTTVLAGVFVFTGTAAVKVLPQPSTPVGELLTNADFEAPAVEVGAQDSIHPAGWLTFTSGPSELISLFSTSAHSGNQVVKFVSLGDPNFYQGFFQALPVTPGETYRFSVYVKNDAARPLKGSVTGQLSIEWHGETGNEMGRLWSQAWSASLAATDWAKFEVTGEAPPNSAKGHFVIVEKGDRQPMAGGVFHVDDASVVKVTKP